MTHAEMLADYQRTESEDQLRELVNHMIEEEQAAREEARKVLGDWVDGDQYFTPCLADIIEELITRIK